MSKWLLLLLLPVIVVIGIVLFMKKGYAAGRVIPQDTYNPNSVVPAAPMAVTQLDITGISLGADGSPAAAHPAVIGAATIPQTSKPECCKAKHVNIPGWGNICPVQSEAESKAYDACVKAGGNP